VFIIDREFERLYEPESVFAAIVPAIGFVYEFGSPIASAWKKFETERADRPDFFIRYAEHLFYFFEIAVVVVANFH